MGFRFALQIFPHNQQIQFVWVEGPPGQSSASWKTNRENIFGLEGPPGFGLGVPFIHSRCLAMENLVGQLANQIFLGSRVRLSLGLGLNSLCLWPLEAHWATVWACVPFFLSGLPSLLGRLAPNILVAEGLPALGLGDPFSLSGRTNLGA